MTARAAIVAMLGLAALASACAKQPAASGAGGEAGRAAPEAAPEQRAPGEPPPAAESLPAVVLTPPGGKPVRVTVELARTLEERRVGLMYRQNLGPDAGMLFLFEEDEIHSFWMKNTLIPLDMIFIRADMTVAGVVEQAEPRTTEGRSIGKLSRHVLEVNGGWARAHGVVEGTKVEFVNLPKEGE